MQRVGRAGASRLTPDREHAVEFGAEQSADNRPYDECGERSAASGEDSGDERHRGVGERCRHRDLGSRRLFARYLIGPNRLVDGETNRRANDAGKSRYERTPQHR